MYKNILVAIDKSELSQKILEHAMSFAEKFSAEITLIYCYEIPFDFTDETIMYNLSDEHLAKMKENLRNHYQDFLNESKKKLESKGIKSSVLLKEGKAGESIVTTVDNGYDLLIMGSKGFGAVKSIILGSVSSYVLHHTKKPLLVVY